MSRMLRVRVPQGQSHIDDLHFWLGPNLGPIGDVQRFAEGSKIHVTIATVFEKNRKAEAFKMCIEILEKVGEMSRHDADGDESSLPRSTRHVVDCEFLKASRVVEAIVLNEFAKGQIRRDSFDFALGDVTNVNFQGPPLAKIALQRDLVDMLMFWHHVHTNLEPDLDDFRPKKSLGQPETSADVLGPCLHPRTSLEFFLLHAEFHESRLHRSARQ